MIHRPYGTTGIDVSAIGFGGMRFPDQKNVEACAELVHCAYDKGVTYFDTAPGYGESEVLFGEAFKEMKKTRAEKPFYVSTKTFAKTPDTIREELERSLDRMGLDSVDFYHMWCIIDLENYELRKAEKALEGFAKVKEEGLAKHIVVSSHMTGSDIGVMLRDYPFDGVLLGYSVMNFAYREKALEAAAELGRGVVVMNPLGGGLIPRYPDRFDFVRTPKDKTVAQGAIRFLLGDERITSVLVGFSNTDEVNEAVEVADTFTAPAPGIKEEIRAKLKESFNELCTACGYCDNCPRQIPVPKMMDAYNHLVLTGDGKKAVNRMNYHWGIKPESDYLTACIECGQCEADCTQSLDICNRLRILRDEAEKVLKERGASS